MVNRTWPSLTSSPSVNLRGPRKPFTRARRSTLSTAAARPMNSERATQRLELGSLHQDGGRRPAPAALVLRPNSPRRPSAAIAKSRVIPISVPRLLAASADCLTPEDRHSTKIKNSQTRIDCRHVAYPAFPSALVLLPEGADRALRGRHAVRAGGRELRRSRIGGGVPQAVAGRQDAGAARCRSRPDGAGVEHHHRVSRPALSARHGADPGRSRRWRCARGWPTASTISMSTIRCSGSSATGCGRKDRRTRSASRRPRRC